MFLHTLARFWRSRATRRSTSRQRARRRNIQLSLEQFEGRLVPSTIIWQDNMESGADGWVTTGSDGRSSSPVSLWHQSQLRSKSPTHAWYYGNEVSRNYETDYIKVDPHCRDPRDPSCYTTVYTANWGTLTSPAISLANVAHAAFTFAEWSQVEPATNKDRTMVDVSTDGVKFNLVFESHGTNGVDPGRGPVPLRRQEHLSPLPL